MRTGSFHLEFPLGTLFKERIRSQKRGDNKFASATDISVYTRVCVLVRITSPHIGAFPVSTVSVFLPGRLRTLALYNLISVA
jgi:hypothetical protein